MFRKPSPPARLPNRAPSVWLLGRADRHRRALEDGKQGSGDDSLPRSISRLHERETQRCGWTSKTTRQTPIAKVFPIWCYEVCVVRHSTHPMSSAT
jgi:hypothetical protein